MESRVRLSASSQQEMGGDLQQRLAEARGRNNVLLHVSNVMVILEQTNVDLIKGKNIEIMPSPASKEDSAMPPSPVASSALIDEWLTTPVEPVDLSDKLCDAIQSAVDDAADRLATENLICPTQDDLIPSSSSVVLLIIEVVIEEGVKASIEVHEHDTAEILARRFAKEHKLGDEAIPNLEAHIQNQIDMLQEEEEEEEVVDAESDKEDMYNRMLRDMKTTSDLNMKPSEGYTLSVDTNPSHSPQSTPRKKKKFKTPSVFTRLYSTAAAKHEWLKKVERQKQEQEEKEFEKYENELKARMHPGSLGPTRFSKYSTPGERLYHEGLADLARKKQEHENKDQESSDEWFCPKCTFLNKANFPTCQNITSVKSDKQLWHSLKSNRISHDQIQYCGQDRPNSFRPTLVAQSTTSSVRWDSEAIHEKLYSKSGITAHRERFEKQALSDFKKTCSFKPKINDKSKGMVSRSSDVIHEQLYKDAEIRRNNLNQLIEWRLNQNPFKPNVGISKGHVSVKGGFMQRLSTYHDDWKKKLKDQSDETTRDPKTGQKLFQPKVGRAPLFNRNETGLPIGEFLFASRNEFHDIRQQKTAQYESQLKRDRERGFVSQMSAKMLEERKARSFEEIYDKLLDSSPKRKPDDDILYPREVDLQVLKPETARVLKSLFDSVEWVPMDRYLFNEILNDAVENRPDVTYSQLVFLKNPEPRDSPTPEELEEKELTFHPKVNPRSAELVQNKNRSEQVFTHLARQQDQYERKKDRLREELERQMEEECPFRPKLVAHNKKYDTLYKRLGYNRQSQPTHPPPVPLSTVRASSPPVRPIVDDATSDGEESEPKTLKRHETLTEIAETNLQELFVEN